MTSHRTGPTALACLALSVGSLAVPAGPAETPPSETAPPVATAARSEEPAEPPAPAPEVRVRHDGETLRALPLRGDRDVWTLGAIAPGVVEPYAGQLSGTAGPVLSVHGLPPRANDFTLDGQDVNDAFAGGRTQPLQDPDVAGQVEIVTAPVAARHRRPGASVAVATRSGGRELDGTAFWLGNRSAWNEPTNLDEAAGRAGASFRSVDKWGGTLGGPIGPDTSFFFGYQRWTDRAVGPYQALHGALTQAGRDALAVAGDRPQVQALLSYLPVAAAPNGRTVSFTLHGRTHTVPLGTVADEADVYYESHQGVARLDHAFGRHSVGARYVGNDDEGGGHGQIVPNGLKSNFFGRQEAGAAWWLARGNGLTNELRLGVARAEVQTTARDRRLEEIPSLEVPELGLLGFLASPTRTGLGSPADLPQHRSGTRWHAQDTVTLARGRHLWTAGLEVRRTRAEELVSLLSRGRVVYPTLQALVDDRASLGTAARWLPGEGATVPYSWTEVDLHVQDDVRLGPTLTLHAGLRYERPGDLARVLAGLNEGAVASFGGDTRFALEPLPGAGGGRLQPRLGFTWAPGTGRGAGALVVRAAYARSHDDPFVDLVAGVARAFPFVGTITHPAPLPFAWSRVIHTDVRDTDPSGLPRVRLAEDLHAPHTDILSVDLSRRLPGDVVVRAAYVGTRGHDLYRTLDGNPRRPFSDTRVDPSLGAVLLRANGGRSWYDALHVSAEHRGRRGVTASLHYTWSRALDTSSDVPGLSPGDAALPQDAFDPDAEKGRSAYDRPHRLAGTLVWSLPGPAAAGTLQRVLGGWTVGSVLTLQSGAPFSPLNGADPTGAFAGLDALAGNPLRPNLATDLDLAALRLAEIRAAGGARLFRALCGAPAPGCSGERVGNVPRNLLRSDGLFLLDVSLFKNTRVGRHTVQVRLDLWNATNTRNYPVPEARIDSPAFLDEDATNAGSRRVWLSLKYLF